MKKRTSKKVLIISISLCLLGFIGYVLACGGDSDYESYCKFLSQEVSHADRYTPFFRSFYLFYDFEEPHHVVDFNESNVKEWSAFFNRKVSNNDLDYLLYKSRHGEIDTLLRFNKDSKYPISTELRKNTILNVSNKNAFNEFLNYLSFAISCETYCTDIPDWTWNSNRSELVKKEDPRKQPITIYTLLETGKRQLKDSKSPFIYQRYLFQIERLYYNAGLYSDGYNFYIQNLNSITINNTIKFRLMEYAAGTLYKMKRYSEANYLFSIVFDQCDLLKKSTFLDFHPQEESDWQNSMLLAKNTREKTVLWLLLGLSRDPFRAVKKIYSLDPKSDLLDPLIVRTISVEEERFIPNRYYPIHSSYLTNLSSDTAKDEDPFVFNSHNLNSDLVEFICTVAKNEDTHKPYLWNLSAGYLKLVKHNFAEADLFFEKAQNLAQNDTLVNEQLKLLKTVSKIEQIQKPDKKFEAAIVKELKWLNDKNRHKALKNKDAYSWALKKLSSLYASNNELEKAIFLTPGYRRSFYADTTNLMKLIKFMNKPVKSEFDNYLLSVFPYHKSDIYELIAVKLMYQGKPKEALAILLKCKGSGNRQLFGDPFQTDIKDCNDCNYDTYKDTSYTKLGFIEEMVALEHKVISDPAYAADYYFTMANGYYNMTYFGSAREMYQTCIRSINYIGFKWRDWNSYGDKKDPIIDCSLAEKYYCKAMELTSDREFKAECCFFAAKCEQNKFFVNELSNYKGDFKTGKYFRKLQAEFSDTKYYQEIIQECGYFAEFVDKNSE